MTKPKLTKDMTPKDADTTATPIPVSDSPSSESPAATTIETNPTDAKPAKGLKKLWGKVKGLKPFWKEIWDDLDFWVNTGAAKAGFGALALGGIAVISYAITLPFALAALTVAGAGTLLAVGVYGVTAGTLTALHRAEKIWRKFKGLPEKPTPESGQKTILQKLREKKFVQKIRHSKPVEAFIKTPLWQKTEKFTKKQQKRLLGSLALSGSIAYVGYGAVLVATQMMVLPMVAIGLLVTTSAITAYTTIHFVGEYLKRRKEDKKAEEGAGDVANDNTLEIDQTPHVSVSKLKNQKKVTQTFKNSAKAKTSAVKLKTHKEQKPNKSFKNNRRTR